MHNQTPLARSDALRAAGRHDAAVTVVRAAADAGDVDALYRLAAWHLVGDPVPRNLPTARHLLRTATRIGHVDAALMEIALVANGSGGAPDWTTALGLLRVAATGDPVAAAQLALIDAMALDREGNPIAVATPHPLSERPDVRIFPALLTAAECRHIATVGGPMLEPAQVADPATGRIITHPIRTSHGAVIGPANENLVIHAINRRLAAASGTAYDQGEPLVVLRYAPGQQYRAHVDTWPGMTNQRAQTMLLYLNQGYGGGETRFLATGLSVAGRAGDVLLFANVDRDGLPDPASRHAGNPVTAGNKWLATRWIRQQRHDQWAPA